MNASKLKTWLAKRRGRMSEMASSIGVSRQMVHQWAAGTRPISSERLPVVLHEMQRIERAEVEEQAA